MTIVNKKEPIFVAFGDILILSISLWVTLVIRYRAIPDISLWNFHIIPFSVVFAFSLLVFYAAGLYGRQNTVIVRSLVPGVIIRSQFINVLLAVILFYLIPAFIVTPKTNLFVYFLIATFALIIWRLSVFPLLRLRRRDKAIVIGSGPELAELAYEMNHGSRSAVECAVSVDLDTVNESDIQKIVLEGLNKFSITHMVIDLLHPKVSPVLPELYGKLFTNVGYIDFHDFYEDIFARIPLSCMTYEWVLENIRPDSSTFYILAKRVIDIVLSTFVGLVAIISFPFAWILIRLGDKDPIFIEQERVGRGGRIIKVKKYRSMNVNDKGVWPKEGDERITRAGRFLRKSRIDELPQVWSVLKGDMSLIGPRPDIRDLGEKLTNTIPYYDTRTLVPPGLSGWAQVNQEKPPSSVEETKVRLSYDLYYIKNRTLLLDLQIALRTARTLLARVGR